jgi:predicted dehydrogenase
LNIGIIGLGHIATNAHIPAIKAIEGANIVAVADINQASLDKARKIIGPKVKLYTDYHKMLEEDIDLVTICLPPYLHTIAALSALEAKKHVLIEKPFTVNLEEAFEVARMSRKHNRKVCVVQNYRFYPAVIEAKNKVTKGELGKILCINTISHVQPPPVSPSQSWVYSKWGILDDFGPHPIDMTNWYMSSNPHKVYCYSGALKKANSITHLQMMITYENGSTATISMSWLSGSTKFELGIMGTAGDILLNVNLNQKVQRQGTFTPYHQIKENLNLTRTSFNNLRSGVIFTGGYGNHAPLIREFIESLVENKQQPVTLIEALRNMMVSEGAKISLMEGRAVDLKELSEIKHNSDLLTDDG